MLVNPDCFPWADSELLRRILYCDLYVELKVPRDDEKPRIQFKPCPITIQHMVHEIRARVFPNVGGVCVCCLRQRQIRTRKRVRRRKTRVRCARSTRHHGPLSNQLGSPGKPEAANTSLHVETENVFIEI